MRVMCGYERGIVLTVVMCLWTASVALAAMGAGGVAGLPVDAGAAASGAQDAERVGQPLIAQVVVRNDGRHVMADWPVFLPLNALLGANVDWPALERRGSAASATNRPVTPGRIGGEGSSIWRSTGEPVSELTLPVQVRDERGQPMRYALRSIEPVESLGNDELILFIPRLGPGETARLTVRIGGGIASDAESTVDLLGHPLNLLSPAGAEHGQSSRAEVVGDDATVGRWLIEMREECEVAGGAQGAVTVVADKGGRLRLRTAETVGVEGGRRYYFSCDGQSENVSYNGFGLDGGAVLRFEPAINDGQAKVILRGDRPRTTYRAMTPIGDDDDVLESVGVTASGSGVRQTRVVLSWHQEPQAFLKPPKRGRLQVGAMMLFEQPTVRVERLSGDAVRGGDGVMRPREVVRWFARPVEMRRAAPTPAERIDVLGSWMMRGERRWLRVGLSAGAALRDVALSATPLRCGEVVLPALAMRIERLGSMIEPNGAVHRVRAGGSAEYLLSVRMPFDVPPGRYVCELQLTADGAMVSRLPVVVDVLPGVLAPLEGYWVGGVYNVGLGLKRDEALYREYAKTGFNYMVLFDYLTAEMDGAVLDLDAADAQVRALRGQAGVRGGIGLYRGPNMSDDAPRKWYQIALGVTKWPGKYRLGVDAAKRGAYQSLARRVAAHAERSGWPTLLYMVSDEPDDRRDVDASMGWLSEALPDAMTFADVQFHDMVRTWQWYRMPVFDDPCDWTGPLLYDWMRRKGRGLFGFCGTGWRRDVGRYQPGLMLASSGARYWHFWHLKGPFEKDGSRAVRSHAVAAMAAGVNDLRYYAALSRAMAEAMEKAPEGSAWRLAAERAAAEMRAVFTVAPADHDRHLRPHNGVPEDWGDVWFYERWRSRMASHLLTLEALRREAISEAGETAGG